MKNKESTVVTDTVLEEKLLLILDSKFFEHLSIFELFPEHIPMRLICSMMDLCFNLMNECRHKRL